MKQRLLAVLLTLCMVVALVPAMLTASAAEGTGSATTDKWTGTVATAFSDDSAGTADDPIEIRSAAEFMYFRNTAAGTATAETCYKLTVNVDLAGKNVSAAPAAFAGVFDGSGNTVSNWLNMASGSVGLFGTVTGTVKNLKVDGFSNKKTVAQFGTIAAELGEGGLISDCHVSGLNFNTGTIQNYLGGIVGFISGRATVQNCSVAVAEGTFLKKNNSANAFYKQGVGGIVGGITVPADTPVSIINCKNTATIASADNSLGGSCGGIVGAIGNAKATFISEVNIIGCTNDGNVSADLTTPKKQMEAGGLVGGMYRVSKLNIQNSVNNGDVTAATGIAGGLVGGAGITTGAGSTVITISDSVNRGAVTALKTGAYAGGLVGGAKAEDAGNIQVYIDVQNSASVGSVTTTDGVSGGIIGSLGTYAGDGGSTACGFSIRGSYVSAAVTAGAAGTAALLCGDMNLSSGSGIVADATSVLAMGTVTGATTGAAVGSSAVTANVTGTYFSGVAGLKLVAAGTAATEATATDADFTGKTVLDALNAAATAAGLPEDTWVKGQASGKPELRQFCTDPDEEPSVPEITIDGASLTIGENVTMNLFVKKTTVDAAGVTLGKISIVDNDNKAHEVTEENDDYYVFTISGISASEFGKNKIYHVQYTTADAPGTPIDCTATKEYSPLQYAINMYGKTDKAGLDALLLSIVNYADAAATAAKTTDASTAFKVAHADADFSTLPTFAAIIAEDKGEYNYDANIMPKIAANLSDSISLTVYLKDTAYTGVTMKVGDTELTGKVDAETQTVKFADFWATDLYNEITLTFTGAEGTLEATTSLVQYLNRYAGDETYAKVATATAQYLYAARNFCLKNRTNA